MTLVWGLLAFSPKGRTTCLLVALGLVTMAYLTRDQEDSSSD